MTRGYVSFRNEDGTQYFLSYTSGTVNMTGGSECYKYRGVFTEETFRLMQAHVEQSKARDCGDNGFFGWYGLKFTPMSDAKADEQELVSEAFLSQGDWYEKYGEDD
jgi:hypothetical protein